MCLQGRGVCFPRSWSFISKVLEFYLQGLGVISPRSWRKISKSPGVLYKNLQGLGVLSPRPWSLISKSLELQLQDLGVLSPRPWSYNSPPLLPAGSATWGTSRARRGQSTPKHLQLEHCDKACNIGRGGGGAGHVCGGVWRVSIEKKKVLGEARGEEPR